MALQTRPNQRVSYQGSSLLVTGPLGAVRGVGAEGFYFHNTRLLSRLEWSIDGCLLEPFALDRVAANTSLSYIQVPEPAELRKAGIYTEVSSAHLELSTFLGDGLRMRSRLVNHSKQERKLVLGLHLAADFSGTAEADQGKPETPGPIVISWQEESQTLEFRAANPAFDRAVRVNTDRPVEWDGEALQIQLLVPPRGSCCTEVTVSPVVDGRESRPVSAVFEVPSVAVVRRSLGEEPTELVTSNSSVQRTWDTSISDLASLPLGWEPGPRALIAGVPLYDEFFGRDTLTTGWQALLAMRNPLLDALKLNAKLQGERIDDWRDEEPGAMIHQAGDGPGPALGRSPFSRYYGDYATPVDFVAMLGQYFSWTGNRADVLPLLPAARRALTWLERYGDLDRDGLLEYRCRSPKGVRNQGWKDAPNAIVDAGGVEQFPPIATVELQGYWYSALRNISPVFAFAGDRVYARRLLAQARRLRQRINARLWLPEEGTYALGLGSEGQVLASVTSNAGHMLLTGVPGVREGHRVAERLMQPDLFSGWGIRTLSSDNPAYNPFSYHLGSVWAVEQGSIAAGFGRYGCWNELHRLARGYFDLAELFIENRIPEAVGGITHDENHPHPGVYPHANAPQSWSASSTILMIQALLGIRPIAWAHLLLIDPHLPDWLPDITLRNLRVGDALIDLHVWRQGGRTKWKSQVRRGSLRVLQRPSLRTEQARSARILERLVSQ